MTTRPTIAIVVHRVIPLALADAASARDGRRVRLADALVTAARCA